MTTEVGDWVELAVQDIAGWPPILAYGALLLSAFLENIIPPVPGDLVVVLSAYLAGRGALHWLPVYLSTCAGGTAGFLVMYYIGRSRGRWLLQSSRLGGRVFSERALERASRWLARYGFWLVLGNRFLSGIRSVIALAAGLGGMGWRPVALLGLLSMLLWNGVLLFAGLQVGQNWSEVIAWLGRYNRIMVGVLLVAGAAGLWRWWRRRATASSNGSASRAGDEGGAVDSPSEEL